MHPFAHKHIQAAAFPWVKFHTGKFEADARHISLFSLTYFSYGVRWGGATRSLHARCLMRLITLLVRVSSFCSFIFCFVFRQCNNIRFYANRSLFLRRLHDQRRPCRNNFCNELQSSCTVLFCRRGLNRYYYVVYTLYYQRKTISFAQFIFKTNKNKIVN